MCVFLGIYLIALGHFFVRNCPHLKANIEKLFKYKSCVKGNLGKIFCLQSNLINWGKCLTRINLFTLISC